MRRDAKLFESLGLTQHCVPLPPGAVSQCGAMAGELQWSHYQLSASEQLILYNVSTGSLRSGSSFAQMFSGVADAGVDACLLVFPGCKDAVLCSVGQSWEEP